jgi:hypothetical protein
MNSCFQLLINEIKRLITRKITDWFEVPREGSINYDLKNTSLEIKIDSELESNELVRVQFLSTGNEFAGSVWTRFASPVQYHIGRCSTSSPDFPTSLPTTIDKIWRITLTRTSGVRLRIHCNDVEVLNLPISAATCGSTSWSDTWIRHVKRIKFESSSDTASDYYRPYIGELLFIIGQIESIIR